LLSLPRGRNDRQIQYNPKSKKCVYTNSKGIGLEDAGDGEGVTMRSGRRLNDDTMSNLNPTTVTFDVSCVGLSAPQLTKEGGDGKAFVSGLAQAFV
jgi:hypothetical protein